MALVGYELLVVAGIILVVVFWGPKKLPEIARSIGLARNEFKKASLESESDPIFVAARNLGITTQGKSKETIEREIAERTKTS